MIDQINTLLAQVVASTKSNAAATTTAITTASIDIPAQTLTVESPYVIFDVPGMPINVTIRGNIYSVFPIIPDMLVYDPLSSSIYNIGKPGVFAIGPRHLAISTIGDGMIIGNTSDTADNTTRLYINQMRANFTLNTYTVTGGNMITLFLATGDGISFDGGFFHSQLSSIEFWQNYNKLIISRLNTIESFADTFINGD